jgi:23S rRNA (cytosine1962-C5)-methyltransferase/23S rRNA (guanine2445-N2)-methyltransferase / 23S rRNA (guanine2069-N7)-methyltransferase
MSAIQNRLEKNYRKLKPWSDRNHFEAYRLYDRDIPEFPYIIDIYKDHVVIYDKSDALKDAGKNHLPPTLEAVKAILQTPDDKLILKKRVRQEGEDQYEKLDQKRHEFAVQESQFKFLVNLWDYLDTGLFLDHRPSRYKVFKMSAGGKRVLNLFSYTSSVSVAAALGGGLVTSVDLSNTYLDWSKRNFELNQIPLKEHSFLQADVLQFLRNDLPPDTYDVIFLDPPTFSNSKRMEQTLDIQKDHVWMIKECLKALKPEGVLLFSTNKRKFKIEPVLNSIAKVVETTKQTIPQDFHDQQIHTSFEIRKL